MDSKILKVTLRQELHYDLIRVLLNELKIEFEDYNENVIEDFQHENIVSDNQNQTSKSIEPIKKIADNANRKKIIFQKKKLLQVERFNFNFGKQTTKLVLNVIKRKQFKYIDTGL